jgi:hypothetical protein
VGLRYHGGDPCERCDLSVTNNLGFSGTVFLGLPKY